MGTFIISDFKISTIKTKKRGEILKTKEKKKGRKGFKIFLIILVVLMLILSDKDIQKKITDLIKNVNTSIKDISFEISKSIPIGEEVLDIRNYRGIVLWNGGKLTKINNDGDIIKEKEFKFDDIGIYMGEKKIYVYDKSSGDIYILNEEIDTIDKIKVEGKIENIIESFDNTLIHTKEEYRESLKILNKDGKIVENIITENRNILTYSTNKESNKYIISTISLEGTGLKSQVQAFEIGGESLFDHGFKDEIVLYTKYITEDKLIIMTDKNLYCVLEDEILWDKPYESLKDIYVDDEYIYILYSNSLDILSENGDVKYNYSFSEEYKKMLVYDKHLVVYGNEYIIGLKEQEEVFKYKTEDIIIKAVKDGKKLMILYKDRIDLVVF